MTVSGWQYLDTCPPTATSLSQPQVGVGTPHGPWVYVRDCTVDSGAGWEATWDPTAGHKLDTGHVLFCL